MQFLLVVLALLTLVALVVANRPGAFRIARSHKIEAPPEAILPLLVDFREWAQWSPWEKLDPAMSKSFEGPASGEGAEYRWSGNKKVGRGRMRITRVVGSERVELDLSFYEPFAAENRTIFTLVPEGEGTTVTWAMEGENNFAAKVFTLFMNMDEMVGKDFSSGLASLEGAVAARVHGVSTPAEPVGGETPPDAGGEPPPTE